MKKFLSLILVGILGIVVFASCNKKDEKKKEEPVKSLTVEEYMAKIDTSDYRVEATLISKDGNVEATATSIILGDRIVYGKVTNEYEEYFIEYNDTTFITYKRDSSSAQYTKEESANEDLEIFPKLKEITGIDKMEEVKIENDVLSYVANVGGPDEVIIKGKIFNTGVIYIEQYEKDTLSYKANFTPGKVAIKYPTDEEIL